MFSPVQPFPFLLCLFFFFTTLPSSHAQRLPLSSEPSSKQTTENFGLRDTPLAPPSKTGVELYSWRTAEGDVLYGLRINNVPPTAEILIEDKKYQLHNQEEIGKALSKLTPGESVLWRHLNQKGRPTRPPEEVEVETKETALKSHVELAIVDEQNLEPEYWKQPRGKFEDALQKLDTATTDSQRLEALRSVCREAFRLKLYPEAKKYALQLDALLPKMKEDWNYGDAVQDSNIVLGRIAVIEGDLDTAKGHLVGAGYSPGSTVMNTMGPDMSLARDLLVKGERRAVIDYLDQCRSFWKTDHGLIDQWSLQIKNGKTPDFGTNVKD